MQGRVRTKLELRMAGFSADLHAKQWQRRTEWHTLGLLTLLLTLHVMVFCNEKKVFAFSSI
jgi:hypothetical protein